MHSVEIQDFGNCIVITYLPENVDPYSMLQYCENVESEGFGQFRFDGVYADTKNKFIKLLKGK